MRNSGTKKEAGCPCMLGDSQVNRTLGLTTIGFLILTLASNAQQPQASPKSSLQGAVLKIGTNEAITIAHVTLYRAVEAPSGTQPSTRAPNAPPLELATDGKGKFVFKDVQPGRNTDSVSMGPRSNPYSSRNRRLKPNPYVSTRAREIPSNFGLFRRRL